MKLKLNNDTISRTKIESIEIENEIGSEIQELKFRTMLPWTEYVTADDTYMYHGFITICGIDLYGWVWHLML